MNKEVKIDLLDFKEHNAKNFFPKQIKKGIEENISTNKIDIGKENSIITEIRNQIVVDVTKFNNLSSVFDDYPELISSEDNIKSKYYTIDNAPLSPDAEM